MRTVSIQQLGKIRKLTPGKADHLWCHRGANARQPQAEENTPLQRLCTGTLGIWKCLCPAEKPSRSQLRVPTSAWSTPTNSWAGMMVPMCVLALVNSLLPSCWARHWDTIQAPGHGNCLTLSNAQEASWTPDILRLIKGQPWWSRSIADMRMSPEILGWPLKIASG